MRTILTFCWILVLISCTTKKEDGKAKLFEIITSEHSNIDFVNAVESKDSFNFLEYLYFYNGGGVAIGDINNDSLPDIYFTSNQNANKLYLNEGDFQFKDISNSSGVEGAGSWTTGVTMADVNGDGLLDIYVCNVDGYKGLTGRNELYINNGDLTFSESAAEFGLDFSGFATHAAFFDYDNDSDLDVYLLNHSVHSAGSYGDASLRYQADIHSGDRLMQSQLAQGGKEYLDVTGQAGIHSSQIGYGLGVATADLNGDGWQDIYVSNDFHENDYLYYNNGDGTFTESLERALGHSSRYSMGNDVGDINNDGRLDIITTDMLPKDPTILMKSGAEDRLEVNDIKLGYGYGHQLARNTIQLNRGDGKFSDIALYARMFATDWSWSPLIADFDNDGYKDIHITNGIFKRPNDMDYIQYISNLEDYRFKSSNKESIDEEMLKRMPTLQIPNEVFKYLGNFQWVSVNSEWGLDQPSYSNGSAYGDLDNDGDLDLVINNVNQNAFVYRNNSDKSVAAHNYIKISFVGSGHNTAALGTRIEIRIKDTVITNHLTTTRGFQSSVEPMLTIGLGEASKIDTLEIFWASGKYQMLLNLDVNQRITLVEPETIEPYQKAMTNTLLVESEELFKYKHEENLEYKDNNFEYLLPYRLSVDGPAISVGDLNGDGMEDIFIGGAAGQAGSVFIQKARGKFEKMNQLALERDRFFEDINSVLVDVDNDNDLDLIVISGGYQYNEGNALLEDRLYINTNANFEKSMGLNEYGRSSSWISYTDFDSDGDSDFFIGYNAIRGKYGESAGGILLVNDGSGSYTNKTKELAPDLQTIGMVTAATWIDFDGDGDEDLAIGGHWMPITILINEGGTLSKTIKLEKSNGFWNSLQSIDIDKDGDLDLMAGNLGLNNKFQVDENHPLKLYVNDFDNNGTSDPIIMHYQEGRYVPLFTKDEIEKQVVSIKKKYTSYKAYAEKVNGIADLFEEEKVKASVVREVNELRSICFINNGNGKFKANPLPAQMQFSAINTIVTDDLNNDGILDIITAGNLYYMHVNLGRLDGDFGSVAVGRGNGEFSYVETSSLNIKGQVNGAEKIFINGKKYYVFTLNNNSLKFYTKKAYEK